MDYTKMELDELKEYAKSIGISFGKIGKEKLIEKIKEKEKESETISSVIGDDEDFVNTEHEKVIVNEPITRTTASDLMSSISDAIDDLEGADENSSDITIEDLPIDTIIPVKSITFGGLTYKSRVNNAIFRWDQIGSIQYMTVADLNEMNNYKRDFLNRPLVILMDERAIKKFRLIPVYENVAKINNLKQVFASDRETISKTIDMALNVNMREILISKVSQMIKNKTLVDVNIIRFVSKKLSYDFGEMIFE